jgi:hypothetical protein
MLEHPDVVAGRRVLDLASGSDWSPSPRPGRRRERARSTSTACDGCDQPERATPTNTVTAELADILMPARPTPTSCWLATCSTAAMAARCRGSCGARSATARGCSLATRPRFPPRDRLRLLATMDVPVPHALESTHVKPTSIWEVPPPRTSA